MKRVISIFLVILMTFGTELALTAQTDVFKGIFTLKSEASDMKQTISSMSVGDKVTFGSYPQSKVTDSALVLSLTAAAPSTSSWTSYNYYSDFKQSDYMKYYDLTYGGNRYRGVYFTKYRPHGWNDSSSSSNSYQDNNGYYTSTVYWFKYEPLTWRVLDPSTGYVICETIIDSQAYNNEYYSKGEDAYGYTAYYNDTNCEHLVNNWEYSTIRKWLNESFYTTAFSATERQQIPCTKLTTPAYSTSYSAYDVGETGDYVFLPSYQDMLNTSYGFSSSSYNDVNRRAHSSDYAKSQGVYVNSSYKDNDREYSSYYRLRSAGYLSISTTGVHDDGDVGDYWYTDDTNYGIRPALCFNPSSSISKSESEKTFRVVDSSGIPVSNATLTFKDAAGRTKSVSTGSDGVAKITGGGVDAFSFGDLYFTVSADGYVTTESEPVEDGDFSVVTLYTEKEADYKLTKAIYYNTDSSYNTVAKISSANLLTNIKRLSTGDKNGYFKIECKSGNTANTVKYQLFQNSVLIAETTDGVFKLRNSMFSQGEGCKVVVVSKDGKEVATNLNLEFTKDVSHKSTSIKLGGKKMSFTVASDVPLFGGSTVDFDFPDLPVELYLEDNKMYVALNASFSTDGKKTIKEQAKEFHQSLADMFAAGATGNSAAAKAAQSFIAIQDKYNMPFSGKTNLTFAGVGETEWNDNLSTKIITFKAYILVDANASKKWQLAVGICPIAVKFTVGVKINTTAQGSIDFDTCAINADWTLDVNPSIGLQGAIGVGDAIGAGVYGNLSANFSAQLLGTTISPGLKSVDLTGEFGAVAYAGPIEYKKALAYQTWHLYTRKNNRASAPALNNATYQNSTLQDMYDTENYALQDLSYLTNESGWLGDVIVPANNRGTAYFSDARTLLSSTYRNAQPSLVASAADTVLVFMSADTERGSYNAQKLVSSSFDKSTSTWSTPVQVDGNATADANPFTYSDGTDVYLAYQDTADTFTEDTFSEDAYTASQTIAVAKYDSGTKAFTTEKTFASTDSFYNNPRLTDVDGVMTLVWLSAENSDIFGQGTGTAVMYSQLVDGEWTDAAVLADLDCSVGSLAAGVKDGALAVLAAVDTDNDFSTQEDAEVRLITADNSTVVYEGFAANLDYEKLPGNTEKTFIFNADDVLFETDGTNNRTVTESIGMPTSIAYLDNRIVCDIISDGKAQVYTVDYDEASASFGEPVAMTNADAYAGNITAVTAGGLDLVVMTKKNVTISEEDVADDTDLVWLNLGGRDDLAVNSVYYLNSDVEMGKNLPIYIALENKGTNAVKTVKVTATNTNNTVVSEKTYTVNLLPGASTELEAVCDMGTCASQEDYTITVTDTSGAYDIDATNNKYVITVGKADAEVTCDMMRVGNQNFATVVVKNNGINPIGGVLDIRSDENSEYPLTSVTVEKLGAGESKVVYYDFNRADFTNDSSVITCTFEGDGDEMSTDNNTDTSTVTFVDNKIDVCGVNITSDKTTVNVFATIQLSAELVPLNASNVAVNWESSDENIATVDSNGLVTTKKTGEVTITCTTAENSFTDTITLTVGCEHNKTVPVSEKVEATCTTDGKEAVYKCSTCDETIGGETIPALGHTVVKVNAVEPTCTEDGYTGDAVCSVCKTEISKSEKIAAKGHTEVVDAAVAATCTTTGKTEGRHCSACGYIEVAQTVIKATGHTSVNIYTIPATCTEQGYTYVRCTRCSDIYKTDYVDAKGHTEVTDAAVAATCTTAGKTEGIHCSICNAIIKAQETVPAKGHTEVTRAAFAATCTTPGATEGKRCSVCYAILVEQLRLPEIGHTVVVDAAVPATCTTEGKTEGKHCSVCNAVISAQSVIPSTGHTAVVDAALPATCTTAGKTEGSHCSVCKEVLVAQKTIPAKGHTEVTDAAVAATCTTAGKTEGKHCSVCNAVIKAQEKIFATGHQSDGGKTTKEPTYGTSGEKTYTCTVCGAVIRTEIIAVLDPTGIFGDVDGENGVTVADARLALRAAVMLESYEKGTPKFLACDVDFDGYITVSDARLILRVAVKLDSADSWKETYNSMFF